MFHILWISILRFLYLNLLLLLLLPVALQSIFGRCTTLYWGFLITHFYKRSRTPLDEWSARRWGLYLHRATQETNIHAISGIRTHDSSNKATAGLRPRGHRDRQPLLILAFFLIANFETVQGFHFYNHTLTYLKYSFTIDELLSREKQNVPNCVVNDIFWRGATSLGWTLATRPVHVRNTTVFSD
jgi:hypothetical protein